jgi:ADP-heptose:LPS heptosyltransferase
MSIRGRARRAAEHAQVTALATAMTAAPVLRGRFPGRVAVVARGLADRVRPRREPADPRRVLVAHHLLLGDTLMLTALLAKLRERYPHADVAMTVAESVAPLYATQPYGVRALGWSPAALPPSLFREAPFDLALIPGDNRYAWLAAAMRARWIVAFSGAPSRRRDFAIDRFVDYRPAPAAWGDLCTDLVEGPPPAAYDRARWPTPPAAPFARPAGPYAVVHVGASSPLKRWPATRSAAIVAMLEARGLAPVITAGRGEDAALRAANPERRHAEFAGTLDLAQMWQLVEGAHALVAPDTGIAHLGRVAGTPTVAIFGPGSATICGAGDFWRDARYRAVSVDPFPCRDQRVLFRREIDWVRRCARTTAECPHARCLDAIGDDAIAAAIDEVIQ